MLEGKERVGVQVKIEFLSSRSVQNSNLTLETDEQKGEKRSGEFISPLGKGFLRIMATYPSRNRARKGETEG